MRTVIVVLGDCRIERVPVEVTANRDNLCVWWIPRGEGVGSPLTRHAARLEVNVRVCAVTGYRG